MFFLLYRHTNDGVIDDFPKISNHLPKISEDSPKFVRRLHERCRTFSENFRRLPKIFEEDPKIFRSYNMKFLAFESLRISLKLNISAARERQAVCLGPLL